MFFNIVFVVVVVVFVVVVVQSRAMSLTRKHHQMFVADSYNTYNLNCLPRFVVV